MKKSLIALAVAGAMTVPAIASADATLYGSFRMAMEKEKNSSLALNDYGSRIGLRGTVDLGMEGTKGIYNWEQGVNLNNGALGNGRYGWIGATGDWGTALGGKADHAHYSWVESYTDVFRSGYGNEDLYLGNFAHKRIGSSLAYVSPEVAGFQGFIGGVFGGDTSYSGPLASAISDLVAEGVVTPEEVAELGPRQKDKAIDAYNLGVKYDANGFYAAATYGAGKTAKFADEYLVDIRTWGLAAGYSINNFDLRANYTNIKDKAETLMLGENNKVNNYSLAGRYTMDNTTFALRHSVVRVSGESNPKSTQAEVAQRMGRGQVFANYIDYNRAAGNGDIFALGYRLDF